MRPEFRQQALIVLIGLVVFFVNLGGASLFDMDEALYGACAREMAQRGDWVVPWFNGQMFPDKPPLMFWLMIFCTKLFGVGEFALRVHAAVFAIATALATYHLGRMLFGSWVGFWAGVIVSTTIIFTVSARAATVDSELTFAITLAILIFVWAGRISQPGRETVLGSFRPGGWLSFALMYAAVGLAVLAKGPVGAIMPLGAIGLFLMVVNRPAREELPPGGAATWLSRLLCMPLDRLAVSQGATVGLSNRVSGTVGQAGSGALTRIALFLRPAAEFLGLLTPGRFFRALWQMRPLTGLAVLCLVAAPWYVLVGMRTDGRWLYEFMAQYNLGPFVKPILGHSGPFYYHLLTVFVGFFPWSVFAVPTAIEVVRRLQHRDPCRVGLVLVICWAAVVIGFWSLVAMKLPHHILPAYPALALLTATFVYAWTVEPARFSRRWMPNAAATLVVVGAGIMVALPIAALFILPGEGMIGLVGLTLVAGGLFCFYYNRRGESQRAMAAFAATSATFLAVAFGFAVLRIDAHQNAPVLAAALRKTASGEFRLAAYRYFRESFVYYTGGPVARCHSPEDLQKILSAGDDTYVFTVEEHEKLLEEQFPGQFEVVARQPRFLGRGDVVLLGRRAMEAKEPQTAKRPSQRVLK